MSVPGYGPVPRPLLERPPAENPAAAWMATGVLLLVLLLGSAIVGRPPSLPSRQWLEDELHGTVVAYETTPMGGFVAISGHDRVVFDGLRADFWSVNNWPPFWRWQLMGLGHGAPVTTDPANVALASCPGYMGDGCGSPPWIFGKINDPAIVELEVERAGSTTRYPVTVPGFAVRLAPLDAVPKPTAYRWLAAAGRVVWQTVAAVEGRWPGEPRVREPRLRRDGTLHEPRTRRQKHDARQIRKTSVSQEPRP